MPGGDTSRRQSQRRTAQAANERKAVEVDDDAAVDYPWLAHRDDRFTLALVLDVGEVLVRHGYPAPAGATLVALTTGLYRALHPTPYLPPPLP
jgi:hypothetical protein